MKSKDIKLGMKVVPFSKSDGLDDLNGSVAWKRAREISQPYLYITRIEDCRVYLNETMDLGCGDYFLAKDFVPYKKQANYKINFSPLRLFFLGAQASGKTTLINKIMGTLPELEVIEMSEYGFLDKEFIHDYKALYVIEAGSCAFDVIRKAKALGLDKIFVVSNVYPAKFATNLVRLNTLNLIPGTCVEIYNF